MVDAFDSGREVALRSSSPEALFTRLGSSHRWAFRCRLPSPRPTLAAEPSLMARLPKRDDSEYRSHSTRCLRRSCAASHFCSSSCSPEQWAAERRRPVGRWGGDEAVSAVAAVYPLAWVAERVAPQACRRLAAHRWWPRGPRPRTHPRAAGGHRECRRGPLCRRHRLPAPGRAGR